MFNTDINAAFRRVPIRVEHRRYSHIVFKYEGVTFISERYRLPFGSVASVHGWDRIGSLLCALGRKLLKIPLSRYVDDFFAADRAESTKVAMDCFTRLIRACMGEDAVDAAKCGEGNPLAL